MPDQKGGPEGGLWYQGMSRVVPGCPQSTPREVGEGSCIRYAYAEHRAEAGDSSEKAQKTPDKAILSALLSLLRLFAAVLQLALEPPVIRSGTAKGG